MFNLFDNPPDHVNEIGTKFWCDKAETMYAHKKGLTEAVVFLVEEVSGRRTRILVEDQNILVDEQTLDAFGIKIDMIAFARKEEE